MLALANQQQQQANTLFCSASLFCLCPPVRCTFLQSSTPAAAWHGTCTLAAQHTPVPAQSCSAFLPLGQDMRLALCSHRHSCDLVQGFRCSAHPTAPRWWCERFTDATQTSAAQVSRQHDTSKLLLTWHQPGLQRSCGRWCGRQHAWGWGSSAKKQPIPSSARSPQYVGVCAHLLTVCTLVPMEACNAMQQSRNRASHSPSKPSSEEALCCVCVLCYRLSPAASPHRPSATSSDWTWGHTQA